jgi:integrase
MQTKYDVVQSWLDTVAYSHKVNESTPYNYRHNLAAFCEFIEATPEQILAEYESSDEKEFKRKYARLVKSFISQHFQNETVGTLSTRVTAIRSFFKYNDLPLGFVPLAKVRTIYHNRAIEKEEIAEIIKLSNLREKAFYAIMTQSGLRPETLCELQIKDVKFVEDPKKPALVITVPVEKTKGSYGDYVTCAGGESYRYLQTYFSKREKTGPEDLLFMALGEVGPASSKSISLLFQRTVDKLSSKGMITEVKREKNKKAKNFGKPAEIRLYNLRKYFRNHCNMGDDTQYMMGHVSGVDGHYKQQDPEDLLKNYLDKAYDALRIESETPGQLVDELTNYKETNEQLKKRVKDLEEKLEYAFSHSWVLDRNKPLGKAVEEYQKDGEGNQIMFQWWGRFFAFLEEKHPELTNEEMKKLKEKLLS